MDKKKEQIGINIFLGSLVSELVKLYGKPTLNAIIYRLGQKPGEIIAKEILKSMGKTEEDPIPTPDSAYNVLENSLTQLYEEEVLDFKESENKYILKIKNVCPLRRVIMSREDLDFGGSLCQFTMGYFESALKILTGMSIDYNFIEKETTDDYCVVELVFRKNGNKSSVSHNLEASESGTEQENGKEHTKSSAADADKLPKKEINESNISNTQ
ncbi:MAG: hypothetical protein ACTSU2_11415 [Promethearchaeota archaeon]